MKKVLSVAMCIAIMLSLTLETFAVTTNETADTAETTENSTADLVAYNGTIEELPDYIEDSYNENEKAESIDIYDENPFSFTTNNTDGTKTVEIFQKPIKYIENEEIKFIDTKLEELSTFDKLSSEYIYECTKAPVKSFFPTKIKDGVTITNDEYEIKCYPNTENEKFKLKDIFTKSVFSKPTLDEENVLTYENVFDDNDIITYTPISTGVKEEIIIEEYNGNNIYEFTVELKDLEPLYLTGNSIPLIDKATGEEVAAISQIDMRDSSQGEAFNTSLFNEIELTHVNGDIYNLKIILDEEFLKSETTVYPVIVDPTLTFDSEPIFDTPVFSGYPNSNFHTNTYNIVGYHGSTYGEAITFIKINNIQNYVYINPNNITSAYLKVYEGSGKTSSATVEVHNVKATWDSKKLTYNTMPTLREEVSTSKTISSSGWYQFKITNYVKNWLKTALGEMETQSQHRGLTLKMSTTGVSSRHFCSADHSTYPPSIIINYTEDTTLESGDYIIESCYNPDGKNLNYVYADIGNSNVVQKSANGNNYQIWKITNLGNGYYTLYSKGATTKAIGVASSSPSNGTNVGLYTSSAGDRIKFRIVKNNTQADTYRILSACGNKNISLDVCGPSNASGANIQTWQYSSVSQHNWRIYKTAPCGNLSYWNSMTDTVSFHTNKHLTVCVEKSSGFKKSQTTLKSYVKSALNNWSELGITYEFTDSSTECDIYVKGVTVSEATAITIKATGADGFTINTGGDGSTEYNLGKAYTPCGWRNVWSINQKSVYIIWSTSEDYYINPSENFSSNGWKSLIAHEIGHALGYEGHTENETLMYADRIITPINNITTPCEDEINHLLQLYSKVS